MANIKDFIKQLEDTSLTFEEQQQALQMIEQSLLESKLEEEKSIEDTTNAVVEAVKVVESNLNEKFNALAASPKLIGKQGDRGLDGKNGKDGSNGRDGRDGKDGKDGLDGEDGAYVTEVEVALDDTLLITLSNGNTVKTSKEITGKKGDIGPQGPKGSKGDTGSRGVPGAGVVSGGTTGQVLVKNSSNDYDTSWTNTPGLDLASPDAIGDVTPNTGAFTSLTSTSGALNGTIGATTPSTGNFTTITGQTEVLRGTGQNFLTQSQSFSTWTAGSTAGITANSITDPLGGGTGTYFYATNPTAVYPTVSSPLVTVAGSTNYTFSIYAQVGTQNSLNIQVYGFANSTYTYLNQPITQTLTGGWVRYSGTFNTSTYTQIQIRILFSSGAVTWTGTQGYYIWGAQLEIGSTLNTYIPTTTTAVYGTPTLSFSGVAGLGLQSDGSLYVSPAGTGALQAQATTSTATGGNARGVNAVDWQTSRSSASCVASGAYSVIGGGYNNTASNSYSIVGGGYGNSVTTNSQYVSVLGGVGNGASGFASTTVGGWGNNAAGAMNFIGGGYNNSGTANAAVTTQSATMNATTAVTLAASNAAIKVGQYITGTSIASSTYVAAISGTSLTLSVAASGSSTSTLSFYTPHGVVVGGGNNQATGSYSFIGGGGDAGTAVNRNTASGDWSTVCGGWRNTASGTGSFVGGGGYNSSGAYANTASGSNSTISGGALNSATALYATVCGGVSNTASGISSVIVGGGGATTRGINGMQAFSYGSFSTAGDNQLGIYQLSKSTTDATASVMTIGAAAASGTNQVILPNNSAYYFKGSVIAGVTGAGNSKAWSIEGAIKRGANAGSTVFIGTPSVNLVAQDAGAATWTVTATIDATNGGLAITVTGQAATTIRWVAKLETTEMTF